MIMREPEPILENRILAGLSEIEALEQRRCPAFLNSVFDPVALTVTVNFDGGEYEIALYQGAAGASLVGSQR